jgi:hypothetical protein
VALDLWVGIKFALEFWVGFILLHIFGFALDCCKFVTWLCDFLFDFRFLFNFGFWISSFILASP